MNRTLMERALGNGDAWDNAEGVLNGYDEELMVEELMIEVHMVEELMIEELTNVAIYHFCGTAFEIN